MGWLLRSSPIFYPFLMRSILITATCLILSVISHAQPGGGGPAPAANVPIDGGASLFLAGGAAYAVRRLRQRRRS